MKKTMILSPLVAGILLGAICSGCGESDETKANIKAIAEAQKPRPPPPQGPKPKSGARSKRLTSSI